MNLDEVFPLNGEPESPYARLVNLMEWWVRDRPMGHSLRLGDGGPAIEGLLLETICRAVYGIDIPEDQRERWVPKLVFRLVEVRSSTAIADHRDMLDQVTAWFLDTYGDYIPEHDEEGG